jgi:hypothetical protein
MLDRANDLIERAGRLKVAVANLQAFCGFVYELDRRCPIPDSPHLGAIRTVRAACLRSAIALVVAILDSKGSDRASLGQIIKLLADTALKEFFVEKRGQGGRAASMHSKLTDLTGRYARIIDVDRFKHVAQLRHDEIGHLLMPGEDTPASEHVDVFLLADEVEQLVLLLHAGLGMSPPHFVETRHAAYVNASMFWDIYLAAISAVKLPTTSPPSP